MIPNGDGSESSRVFCFRTKQRSRRRTSDGEIKKQASTSRRARVFVCLRVYRWALVPDTRANLSRPEPKWLRLVVDTCEASQNANLSVYAMRMSLHVPLAGSALTSQLLSNSKHARVPHCSTQSTRIDLPAHGLASIADASDACPTLATRPPSAQKAC